MDAMVVWWTTLSNTLKNMESLLNLIILTQPEMDIVNPMLKLKKLTLNLLMSLQTNLYKWKLLWMFNPFQLQLPLTLTSNSIIHSCLCRNMTSLPSHYTIISLIWPLPLELRIVSTDHLTWWRSWFLPSVKSFDFRAG